MSYHIHTTLGIVLKRTPVGEANVLVHILTKDLGLIMASVQGVRKISSKLRFGLQEFGLVSVSCIHSKNGWKITNSAPKENFYFEYTEEKRRVSAQIIRLLLKMIPGEEIHPEVFDVVLTGFERLKTVSSIELLDFECVCVLRILYHLGYVGEKSGTEDFITGLSWGSDVLVKASSVRSSLVSIINTGLTASNL